MSRPCLQVNGNNLRQEPIVQPTNTILIRAWVVAKAIEGILLGLDTRMGLCKITYKIFRTFKIDGFFIQ